MTFIRNQWSPREVATLHEMLTAGATSGEIARALGKTMRAVESKLSRDGIRVNNDRHETMIHNAARIGSQRLLQAQINAGQVFEVRA